MTPEVLRNLIAGGETLDVEFKGEEKAPLSDRDLVEAVVCLTNRPSSEPAWLLIGVEDDGRITGVRPRHEAGRTDTARRKGRLRAAARLRTPAARADAAAIRSNARPDHSQGGGRAVPVVARSSLSATHAADRRRAARTTRNQERSLV